MINSKQSVESRLRESENRANRIENELAVANATLVERTNQLTTIQKELDQRRSTQGGLDETMKKEKVCVSNFSGKMIRKDFRFRPRF